MNESGLYSLIFGSKLESAKAFKRWVTKGVLPSIRKTGRYDYCIDHKYNNTLTFEIENEMDLHVKVISFLKKRYPHSLFTVTLGENQDNVHKRIDSSKKGYLHGSPDLIINNLHKRYTGFCINPFLPSAALYFPRSILPISLSFIHLKLPMVDTDSLPSHIGYLRQDT